MEEKKISILELFGDVLSDHEYIVNPAIAREEELKKLILTLLTPEKSAILIGPAGSGKTAVVEGVSYLMQLGQVPEALKGYKVIKVSSSALIGLIDNNGQEEHKLNLLIDELKNSSKIILFIDEIHTLIGSESDGPLDFANMLKPALDRGDIKVIGATTNAEYEQYVITDRAFLRRFLTIDINEPDIETTVKIMVGTMPKIEKKTGVKWGYGDYTAEKLSRFIVDMTSQYKRLVGISSNYPDISLAILANVYSQALYDNRNEIKMIDVYNAIIRTQSVYPDVLAKDIPKFAEEFKHLLNEEGVEAAVPEELKRKF